MNRQEKYLLILVGEAEKRRMRSELDAAGELRARGEMSQEKYEQMLKDFYRFEEALREAIGHYFAS